MNKAIYFTYLTIFLNFLFFSSCTPALPGSIAAPKDFKNYNDRVEKGLKESQKNLAEAKEILKHSESMLEEARAIKAKIDISKQESMRVLSRAQAERKIAEKAKIRANKILAEAKAEKERVVEVVQTPIPQPSIPTHSITDAP